MKKITVSISEHQKQYPIIVGEHVIEEISSLTFYKNYSQIVIITDETVRKLWLAKVLEIFSPQPHVIVLPAGEKNKTIYSVEVIWKELHAIGSDRKSLIINLGGGVISDLGGFAASTYMRGLDFLNIPTSLLAAVDASVGGKTGIDFITVKNLIGTFQQPVGVIVDVALLETLPQRHIVNGFAEIIKHG